MSSLPCCWQDVVAPPVVVSNKPYNLYNSQFAAKKIVYELRKNPLNLSHSERDVLIRLSELQGPTGQLNVSNEKLSADIGLSEVTIRRSLKKLEDIGILKREYYLINTKTKTTHRRQINVCWDSLVISDPITVTTEIKSTNTELESTSIFLNPSDLRCAARSQEFNSSSRGNNVIPFKKENRMDNQPLVSSESDNVVPFPFDPDPLKATPIKERFTKIEKMIDEAMMDACNMDPRALRIYRLTSTMEDVKRFLTWEGIDLPTLKQRMQVNLSYDPLVNPDDIWCEDCHSNYAHLEESKRDEAFHRCYEKYMAPFLITNQTPKNILTMLSNARKRADSVKAIYTEYIAAQYAHIGSNNVDHRKMLGKFGIEIYEKWKENGSVLPANYGWLSFSLKNGMPFQRKRAYAPRVSTKQRREALIETSSQEIERDPTYLKVVK